METVTKFRHLAYSKKLYLTFHSFHKLTKIPKKNFFVRNYNTNIQMLFRRGFRELLDIQTLSVISLAFTLLTIKLKTTWFVFLLLLDVPSVSRFHSKNREAKQRHFKARTTSSQKCHVITSCQSTGSVPELQERTVIIFEKWVLQMPLDLVILWFSAP